MAELEAVHSGPMKKRGRFGTWKNVFCELIGNNLYVEKTEKQRDGAKKIAINPNTRISVRIHDKTQRLTIDADAKSHVFTCDDDGAVLAWELALRTLVMPGGKRYSMDDFEILNVIGRGFYGKVMLVKEKQTGSLFAIKTVRKAKLARSNKVHTIVRERTILEKAHNPFIVQLFFAFQTASKFYLGLEYVPGGELFRRLQYESVISKDQVQLYVAEIAIALNYLHSIGILYRDLKPENILIGANGHVKLTDFGLSKEIGPNGSTSTFCGTPEYVAPEIALKGVYSYAVDWWALGILTYELLFEETPFNSENRAELFDMIIHKEPTFPPNASAVVVDFIKKLLVKDPKRRATFEDIKHHPFWDKLDLDAVARLEVDAKFIPQIDSLTSPDNFDSEFTGEMANDSLATPIVIEINDDEFPSSQLVVDTSNLVPSSLP